MRASSIDGLYRKARPGEGLTTEKAAIAALKGQGEKQVAAGMSWCSAAAAARSGMEETYQVTSALKYLPWGKHVAVLRCPVQRCQHRACVGHITPEALAGGPSANCSTATHRNRNRPREARRRINLIGHGAQIHDVAWGTAELQRRPRGPICMPTNDFPPIRDCGPYFNTPGRRLGAASTIPMQFAARSHPAHNFLQCVDEVIDVGLVLNGRG